MTATGNGGVEYANKPWMAIEKYTYVFKKWAVCKATNITFSEPPKDIDGNVPSENFPTPGKVHCSVEKRCYAESCARGGYVHNGKTRGSFDCPGNIPVAVNDWASRYCAQF